LEHDNGRLGVRGRLLVATALVGDVALVAALQVGCGSCVGPAPSRQLSHGPLPAMYPRYAVYPRYAQLSARHNDHRDLPHIVIAQFEALVCKASMRLLGLLSLPLPAEFGDPPPGHIPSPVPAPGPGPASRP